MIWSAVSLQIFYRLSSTNFTWYTLEYFVPHEAEVVKILNNHDINRMKYHLSEIQDTSHVIIILKTKGFLYK